MWIACASTALSLAALAGFAFLVTAKDSAEVRERSAWLSGKLAPVMGKQALDELATTIEQVWPSCAAGKPCMAAASPASHVAVLSMASPPAGRQPMRAATTAGWPEPERVPEAKPAPEPNPAPATVSDPEPAPDSPVSWLLEGSGDPAPTDGADGLLIGGVNVSGQDLKDVEGILKPDSNRRELTLALKVEGSELAEGAVIPAGARFSLAYESPDADGAAQTGGAILTFSYSHAGQEKKTILYLTAPMIARLAGR